MTGPRRRLVDACRALARAGLSPGSSGNASVRVGDGGWITASGTSFGDMVRDEAVPLDRPAPDGRPASKEAGMHLAVYRARPEVAAIVHLHSPAATALSCLRATDDDPLPPYTPYRLRLLGRVVRVSYAPPGSAELAALAGRAAADSPSLLLANHGFLVGAVDLAAAVSAAAEFEAASALTLALAGRDAERLDPETAWGPGSA